jgi:hypothetical protein
MAVFHPLVKVIIFPTSFSALPLFKLTAEATCAMTPARGSGVRNKATPRLWPVATEFAILFKKVGNYFLKAPADNCRRPFIPAQGAHFRSAKNKVPPFRGREFKPAGRQDPGEVPVGHNQHVIHSGFEHAADDFVSPRCYLVERLTVGHAVRPDEVIRVVFADQV